MKNTKEEDFVYEKFKYNNTDWPFVLYAKINIDEESFLNSLSYLDLPCKIGNPFEVDIMDSDFYCYDFLNEHPNWYTPKLNKTSDFWGYYDKRTLTPVQCNLACRFALQFDKTSSACFLVMDCY